ncbi:endonuclease/exonuclease/phosphatase family protein [Candidatus Parcubacteria bacterium]|nr:MAG: endonuclease/exonuclease/phosphatase family protein [Candidatus Parcubacteria bacterium]
MRIKVIQLNLWQGMFLDKVVEFLRIEDPDIITLQEVSGGAQNRWSDKEVDVFTYLQKHLPLEGRLSVMMRHRGDPGAYMGVAVFAKGSIVKENVLWLKDYAEVRPNHNEEDWPTFPRSVLDCAIKLGGATIHALSWHGAWTREPKDTPQKIQDATTLAEYLKNLDAPFVLGCDSNMTTDSQTIKKIEAIAENPAADPQWKITRSLHPTIHKTAQIKPDGLLVDFLFTSKHFRPISIDAPVIPISDHLPIRAVFELKI